MECTQVGQFCPCLGLGLHIGYKHYIQDVSYRPETSVTPVIVMIHTYAPLTYIGMGIDAYVAGRLSQPKKIANIWECTQEPSTYDIGFLGSYVGL